jgi:hypothetical protein
MPIRNYNRPFVGNLVQFARRGADLVYERQNAHSLKMSIVRLDPTRRNERPGRGPASAALSGAYVVDAQWERARNNLQST